MKRVLVALGLVAGLLLLTPSAAFACSCAALSAGEKAGATDTVVDAELDWVATNGVDTTYGLTVTEVYKGKAAESEKVRSNASPASCGLGSLATEQRYLFFLEGEHPGQMRASSCTGPVPYDAASAAAVEKVTGKPSGPFVTPPARSGPVDQDPIHGTSVWTVLGTSAVLVLVLGGLVFLRQRA